MSTKNVIFDFGLPISTNLFHLDNEKSIFSYQENILIITVLSGAIDFTKNMHTRHYAESDMALVDSNIPFEIKATAENTYILTTSINTKYYQTRFPDIHTTVFSEVPEHMKSRILTLVLDSSFALNEQNSASLSVVDDNIKTALNILINNCQFFSNIIQSNYSSPQTQLDYTNLIQNILSYINSNFDEKITLGDFAKQHHMSENYLSHLIKKISGATFKEILAFARCLKAQTHLLEPVKNINEIAYMLGFSTPAYFKNTFKKFYGLFPDEFRKKYEGMLHGNPFPPRCDNSVTRAKLINFANEHNIPLSLTTENFFTFDAVQIDHYIEHFQKVLSDEGEISNIDSEINESSHQAFLNMKKEFRMNTIKIDAIILTEERGSASYLDISNNINYLLESGFNICFVIHQLTQTLVNAICSFLRFYSVRSIDTLEYITFSIRVQASEDELIKYKWALSEKLRSEIGMLFKISIVEDYSSKAIYLPALYDSFILAPFAMDELFHPENWEKEIKYSLIDSVNKSGTILEGGYGLLCWNGLKKPWWHAYNLSSKLRGAIISKGKDHIITNNNDHITILTYNTCGLHNSYLDTISSNQQLLEVTRNRGHSREHGFQLSNIFGKYKIIRYTVNEKSCLFSKWANLDYPEYLTAEEENILAQVCHPEVTFETAEINGKIDINTREESFGVSCIVLEKIK